MINIYDKYSIKIKNPKKINFCDSKLSLIKNEKEKVMEKYLIYPQNLQRNNV